MQQEFFETFVEHCPAAVAVLDREMKYLSVSKRWLSNFGLLDQNLTGKCHYDVFPDVPERWRRIHQQCLGGQVEKCDLDVFPRADGSTCCARAPKSRLRCCSPYQGKIRNKLNLLN